MKYIFYSHSPITQIVIDAIINEKNILTDDIVIVYNRVAVPSLNGISTQRYIQSKKIYIHKLRHKLILDYQISRFYKWLDKITCSDTYELFIPHTRDLHLKALTLHEKCISVNLIEEGSLSYCTKQIFDSINNEVLFPVEFSIFYRNTLKKDIQINNCYILHEKAFGFYHKKINVLNRAKKLARKDHMEVHHIMVMTPYVSILGVPLESFINKFKVVITELCKARSGVKIHYKFHPSDSETVKDQVRIVFKQQKNVQFIELSREFNIEKVLLSRKVNLLAFRSVVCFYAKITGSPVYILDDFFGFEIVSPRSSFIDNFLMPERVKTYDGLRKIRL